MQNSWSTVPGHSPSVFPDFHDYDWTPLWPFDWPVFQTQESQCVSLGSGNPSTCWCRKDDLQIALVQLL